MSKIINASIDFSKMKSAKFKTKKGTDCILIPIDQDGITTDKNGNHYLAIDIAIKDEKNQWGQDTSLSIQQSKEQREAKKERIYIGNGKTVWESSASTNNSASSNNEPTNITPDDGEEENLPF